MYVSVVCVRKRESWGCLHCTVCLSFQTLVSVVPPSSSTAQRGLCISRVFATTLPTEVMPPLESPPEPPPKPPPTLPAISTLIPYALSLAAWLGLAAWTVSLDSQSYAALQLLLTCTIFAAVVFHLRRRPAQNLPDGAGVGAENEERKLSAYSVFNPGCQRLLGEIDPAAFDDHYRNLPP
mmetsp:Transcript_10926/g.27512  ORF Transcript_10926/g.27512 Transcript_10926/m.27512 type:complete len:180 (-) Transcript_10926:55-594(-)